MKKLGNRQLRVFSTTILVVLLLLIYYKIDFSIPHEDENSLRISSTHYFNETLIYSRNFSMLEFSDEHGTKQNISSIDFDLGSSRWNVTSLELNFTDIKLERETITVEENGDNVKTVSKKDDEEGWGVQINITERTLVFGVYIYGYYVLKDGNPPSEDVTVEIRGFNEDGNKANDTIYTSTLLNMGENPGSQSWLYQNFSKPPLLNEGQYYLVINGSKLINDKTKYFWIYNDPSTNPNLHICKYTDEWKNGESGKAFRYKLVQRVNKTFSPKAINMTAEIGGTPHIISNEPIIGKGNLTLPNINFSPNFENLHIPITHNQSFDIFFNLSYYIYLENNFFTNGSVIINKNSVNQWYLTHIIDKCTNNYSIRFNYPKSWNISNLCIAGQNITQKIIKNTVDNFIILPNNTIINNAKLEIFAVSPNVDFPLIVPKNEFKINEFLNFTIYPPNSEGSNNITYVLIDEEGYEINKETEINPEGPINISYQIALYPYPGYWKALIFWNNETDAGFQSQTFLITSLTIIKVVDKGDDDDKSANELLMIDQSVIISFALIVGSIVAASIILYVQFNRIKGIQANKKQKILNKYKDTLNLQSIIISDEKSGLSVFELTFTKKDIDGTLLSGFLEAIRKFGMELLNTGEESPIIKIEFRKSKLLLMEFDTFRINFIMKEVPSQEFLISIKNLSSEIEEKYGRFFEKFKGDLIAFEGLKELINHNLDIFFLSPLKVNQGANVKMNSSEKSLFYRAINYMTKNKLDHFYAKNLLPPNEYDYKDIEIFRSLENKNLFQMIE